MYNWFWSALKLCGVTVTLGPLDMGEVNPLDVPWSAARWSFWWGSKRIGGSDGEA